MPFKEYYLFAANPQPGRPLCTLGVNNMRFFFFLRNSDVLEIVIFIDSINTVNTHN